MQYRNHLLNICSSLPLGLVEKTQNGSLRVAPQPDIRSYLDDVLKNRKNDFLFFHRPLSHDEIAEMESNMGRAIPSSYRDFLLDVNGGSFFFRSLNLFGKTTLRDKQARKLGRGVKLRRHCFFEGDERLNVMVATPPKTRIGYEKYMLFYFFSALFHPRFAC